MDGKTAKAEAIKILSDIYADGRTGHKAKVRSLLKGFNVKKFVEIDDSKGNDLLAQAVAAQVELA